MAVASPSLSVMVSKEGLDLDALRKSSFVLD